MQNPNGDKLSKVRHSINTEYFSGSQAHLFIGDIWVDDILSIQYSLTHHRSPIYGYGSQHFDFMPKGNILINGSFVINFREPNYLWMILKRYEAFQLGTHTKEKSKDPRYLKQPPPVTMNEALQEQEERRNLEFFFSTESTSKARENKEILQQRLSGVGKSKQTYEHLNHGKFAILLGYGQELNENTVGEKINDVFIVGKGKAVVIDGRPIQEEYSFLARMLT